MFQPGHHFMKRKYAAVLESSQLLLSIKLLVALLEAFYRLEIWEFSRLFVNFVTFLKSKETKHKSGTILSRRCANREISFTRVSAPDPQRPITEHSCSKQPINDHQWPITDQNGWSRPPKPVLVFSKSF